MEAGLPVRLTREPGALPGIGIVHLGLGAFFRAHGAVFTQEAMAASGGDWGILGISLQSPTIRDQLAPQAGLYTALELAPTGPKARLVDVVQKVLVAPEDPEAVLAAMAAPGVRIVSLTVTEKGYCHEPATGRLNLEHPGIAHDLVNDLPRTSIGFLVRGLQRRFAAGLAPFTVMTCDNLPHNGQLLRGLVLDFAGRLDKGLAAWIAEQGRFPCTMVDRIVPATTEADRERVAALTGFEDASPVVHEPFRQWVIEDAFVGGLRPDWGRVGAEMVVDVAPYEFMKLRMLNGTHSSLAYLGYLAGHETIADCLADDVFRAFVRHLWAAEIIPALTPPPGVRLADYASALETRYENPGIRHRTWQIAMDGSQKLPQRILGTLAENLKAGRPCPGLMLAVAAWAQYVSGKGLDGKPIDVRDPLAATLAQAANAADPITALLAMTQVFPPELAPQLATGLQAARNELLTKGARGAIQALT
ncbi:mannitol dehydrogenase family protein [Neogemmobacter tilapiae]|uniref:mannitol dehydrogenase family protein n=1 Tax=Neogemmobacter tilapiae TaxID=875041 RepID=UPI003570CFB4